MADSCPPSRHVEEDTLEITWRGSGGPWLLEVGSPTGGAVVEVPAGRAMLIGSSPAADVRVDDRSVSARHCLVRAEPRGVSVEDLGSTNGVYFGGARVASATVAGKHGSFVIGQSTICIREHAEPLGEIESVDPIPGLIGSSLAMRRVASEVRRHAGLRAPVLIQGETGTGKDVVAQALHALSKRPGAYVPLNVGAIVESLADAELFGHGRGAFTGAIAARSGAFEQAHRGSLFLDEIAELSPALQTKLLRVVEDGVVRPLGAQPLKVDVRLIAASWARLGERVEQRRFRLDLFHRLSTVVIELPPLRERKSDISALASVLLERMAAEVGMKKLSSDVLARLVSYSWPGNVRELASVLYRAAVASQEPVITSRQIVLPTAAAPEERPRALAPAEVLELFERSCRNATAAARAARVPRTTFRAWLSKAREQSR